MAFAALGDHERAWELFNLINPVRHGATPEGVATYKVEPYVAVADIYARPPHTGRGGWSWYTGSAGWFYRLIVESLLGLHRQGDRLELGPCVPAAWQTFAVNYRFGTAIYRMTFERQLSEGEAASARQLSITLDGAVQDGKAIPLSDDGGEHWVTVTFAA